MSRQMTLVMFRRAKSKRRKAAGSPNTGEYSGDRERREAQPFRRLNRGKCCLPGHLRGDVGLGCNLILEAGDTLHLYTGAPALTDLEASRDP